MAYVNKGRKILIKNHMKMIEIKNSLIKMKTSFNGLISRCDTAKKKISKLEDVSVESYQI